MGIMKDSLTHFILAFLMSGHNTATFKRLMQSDFSSDIDEDRLSVALSRLHKKQYVSKGSSGWSITNRGRREITRIGSQYITCPFGIHAVKNTLVAYDIAENNRKARSWLRNQLEIFNYSMLQKSLWFGPGPLPLDFLHRIRDLGLSENVKIFTVKKREGVNKNN
jgi:DNA-binding transcriptional regulator PaaX